MKRCEKCGEPEKALVNLNNHLFCKFCFRKVCDELAGTILKTFAGWGG